jgi:hypothetical protein
VELLQGQLEMEQERNAELLKELKAGPTHFPDYTRLRPWWNIWPG